MNRRKTQHGLPLSSASVVLSALSAFALAPWSRADTAGAAVTHGPRMLADAGDKKDGQKKKDEEPSHGDPVAVEKLPKAVVDAVKKALPGVRIVKAYKQSDGNYFIDDAKVGKKEWDVTVTPEGRILKKEEMKDDD